LFFGQLIGTHLAAVRPEHCAAYPDNMRSNILQSDPVIALTGASGFIGSHILRRLQDGEIKHRLLVRDPRRLRGLQGEYELVCGGLEDDDALERLMAGATAVIHCAGSVRGVTRDQFDLANATGTAACATAAAAAGVEKFLLVSSLAAREPRLSPYAASKREGERNVLRVSEDMAATIIRPPAVYGPGDKELLPILRIMAKGRVPIFGSPDARFSFIYVEDLAEATVAWLKTDITANQVFEIDDGKKGGYGWSDFAATVAAITGRPVTPIKIPKAVIAVPAAVNWMLGRLSLYSPMLTPGKVRELSHPDWVCRTGAAGGLPGWRPRHTLREGLMETPGWRD
jgi:nucleoside-diphosphate-sugar epimerase